MRIFIIVITFFLFFNEKGFSQTPAKTQQKPVLLIGGTAHIGTGEVLNNSLIAFKEGKITKIEEFKGVLPDTAGFIVIDAKGKHIYPGIIAPVSVIGLTEIDMVRSTNDYKETGKFNPSVRSVIAYNADSKVIPTIRSNGILLAQIAPVGGIITGSSSIMELDSWNWEDAVYKTDDGIHLNWPVPKINENWSDDEESIEEKKSDNSVNLIELNKLFEDAKQYSKFENHEVKNLKLESLRGLFDGTKKLFIQADDAKEIISAVLFCKKHSVKMVLVGGKDCWMITDMLKDYNIPVIYQATHNLPARKDEDADMPYKVPFLLQKAGVQFCLSMGGKRDHASWNERNLPFIAGTAVAYGLTKEQALQSITSNTAKILGVDKSLGTLEQDKDATLIISTGDLLDMRTNNIEAAYIRGKFIDLNNKQKELYKKYSEKYFSN